MGTMRKAHMVSPVELTLLRSLVAVADHGSIGEAAVALHLSQPALTRRVQQLERDFGVDLVERSGRGIVLTELGRVAVREGRVLVERLDRLAQELARRQRLEAGVVRVGGGATAVGYVLPLAIAAFRRRHPGVRFEVREAGSREIERAVEAEDLELGIVTLPVDARELSLTPLGVDRLVLVAGPGHPLLGAPRVTLADLDGQSIVGFDTTSAVGRLIDGALREAGVTVNVVMELRSVGAILRMVETTGSLGFVSEVGSAGARVVPVEGLSLERQLAVAAWRGRPLSPAASAFLPYLERAAAERR
jgi:DNA-binding transcriptional LysR family regulator